MTFDMLEFNRHQDMPDHLMYLVGKVIVVGDGASWIWYLVCLKGCYLLDKT